MRDGHIEDLEKTAGLNTLLWGGIYNPIIPVGVGKERLATQLLHLFAVDVLYAVEQNELIDQFLAANSYLASPNLRALFEQDWHSKKLVLGYLDSLNIIDKFWEKEFKHSPEGYVSNCAFLKWEDHDPLRAVFALQFGWFSPVGNLKDDFERAFRIGMRAQEVTIGPSGIIGPGLATNIYPIQLTGLDLQGYGGGFRSRGGLYIGNETDFTDLLYFWNLRAAGHSILFLPMSHTDRMGTWRRST